MCISLTVLCLYAEIQCKNNGDHNNRYSLHQYLDWHHLQIKQCWFDFVSDWLLTACDFSSFKTCLS